MLISMAHAKDIGFATGTIVDWLGASIINRFHHPDFNWYRGADYQIPMRLHDGTGGTTPIPTWFAPNDSFAPQPGPTELPRL